MTSIDYKPTSPRAIAHYLIATLIFTLYGARVCPFIESLPPAVLLLQTSTAFMLLLGGRILIHTIYPFRNIWRYELALFTGAGICYALWFSTMYDFPWESNVKVLFGMAVLGLVISLDLSLEYQMALLKAPKLAEPYQSRNQNLSLVPQAGLAGIALVVTTTIVFGLVITKDLLWLVQHSEHKPEISDIDSILKEFAYVAVVTVGYVIVLSKHGASVIHYQLRQQTNTMVEAAGGDWTCRVPAHHNGELGTIATYTNVMLDKLQQQYEEVNKTRDAAILGLSTLAEFRDNETGAHILRTQSYVKALACVLRHQKTYADYLSDETIDLLYKSAPLHDIGKVGIPDSILLKPGKLTDDEFAIMKNHATLGAQALQIAEQQIDGPSFLTLAKEIAATHHEKWDGSGYPLGLAGEEIPLSGRLMALADVYDALISRRVYKPAFSHEKARSIILDGKGGHFDPDVVDAFIASENLFVEIAQKFNDDDSHDQETRATG